MAGLVGGESGQRGELEHRLRLHALLRLGRTDAIPVLVENLIVEDDARGNARHPRLLHRSFHEPVEPSERLVDPPESSLCHADLPCRSWPRPARARESPAFDARLGAM